MYVFGGGVERDALGASWADPRAGDTRADLEQDLVFLPATRCRSLK
jgi:hypothetical protein